MNVTVYLTRRNHSELVQAKARRAFQDFLLDPSDVDIAEAYFFWKSQEMRFKHHGIDLLTSQQPEELHPIKE